MRTIGVVTVARSDYSILLPVLRRIAADPALELRLLVAGMHLAPEFGRTVDAIEADGFEVAERVEMLLASDAPEAIAKSIGIGVMGFSQVFGRWTPDLLVLLGDRFEMLAAAAASLPFRIPIAHLHGGESTEGAFDEAIRHAITKMSHLHFVATEAYARRVVQLGEAPWRVTVSGAPALDGMAEPPACDRAELQRELGIGVDWRPLLVTFHPVTLEHERTDAYTDELLAALAAAGMPVVFTYPNADTAGRGIIRRIRSYVEERDDAVAVENLGTARYHQLMALSAAMVGNSSSGIIEAASFRLPVVNIGARQRGRIRAANVIDVPPERDAIRAAIETATSDAFRTTLAELVNPYGDGRAAERIVARLRAVPLDEGLVVKTFHDLPAGPEPVRPATGARPAGSAR